MYAVSDCSCENDMSLIAIKTKGMNISMTSTGLLTVNTAEIIEVSEFKILGETVDRHMSFAAHVENIFSQDGSYTPFWFQSANCVST